MAAKKFRPLHFVDRKMIHNFLNLLSNQLEALPDCHGYHFHLINSFSQVRFGNLIVEYYDQLSFELFIESLERILNNPLLSKLIQKISSTRFVLVTSPSPCFLMDIKIASTKSLPFTLLWYGSVPWKIQIMCKRLQNEGKILTPSGVVDLSSQTPLDLNLSQLHSFLY